MNSRLILIIVVAVLVIILFFIGISYLLSRVFSPSRVEVVAPTPTPVAVVLPPAAMPTDTPIPTPTITPTETPTPTPTNIPTPTPISLIIPIQPPAAAPVAVKIFQGPGFTLFFPATWGLLTCNNSPNFELDPDSNIDQQITCGFARKPITVLIRSTTSGCLGETVILGNHTTIRSVSGTPDFTVHRWCTVTSPVLDITERVSPIGSFSSTPIDHSGEIETMIANTRFMAI